MGIKQDVKTSLLDWSVTRIEGQPTKETISKLENEITELCTEEANMDTPEWLSNQRRTLPFPTMECHSSFQPTQDLTQWRWALTTHEQQVTEHKAEINKFETYLGMESVAWKKIVASVEQYFIFMVSFGHFPQMVTRQMANIIYLIKVREDTNKISNIFEY